MICTKCNQQNHSLHREYVQFPLEWDISREPRTVTERAVIRWACERCGRYHFMDGSPYDYKKAQKMRKGK